MSGPPFAPACLISGEPARGAWDFGAGIVPLNHGSYGAVPRAVTELQGRMQARADRSAIGWFPHTPAWVAQARAGLAGFVGAAADDTVFVPNASAAATVVYNSLRLEPGDEILVTDHAYGAIVMGAERLARRTGAVLRALHLGLEDDDEAVVAAFTRAIGPRTKLVVVDQITSPTARILPTARIADVAHAAGARVLVDGAHAPGLIGDAARVAGGDWWFGNLHKWPSAPRGSALLVTSAADRDELWPLIDSWHARLSYPERFDMQGTLDVTPYLASPMAIGWLEENYGWARARATMTANADAAADAVAEAVAPYLDGPARPTVASPAPSMRLVRLPGALGATREEADSLRDRLYRETGIESAFTSFDGVGFVRLSVHLYTTAADIDAFNDRAVPLLVEWSREPGAGRPATS